MEARQAQGQEDGAGVARALGDSVGVRAHQRHTPEPRALRREQGHRGLAEADAVERHRDDLGREEEQPQRTAVLDSQATGDQLVVAPPCTLRLVAIAASERLVRTEIGFGASEPLGRSRNARATRFRADAAPSDVRRPQEESGPRRRRRARPIQPWRRKYQTKDTARTTIATSTLK